MLHNCFLIDTIKEKKLMDFEQFEWDYEKNKRNIKIHNIRFETAMNVFKDEYRLEYFDENIVSMRKDIKL